MPFGAQRLQGVRDQAVSYRELDGQIRETHEQGLVHRQHVPYLQEELLKKQQLKLDLFGIPHLYFVRQCFDVGGQKVEHIFTILLELQGGSSLHLVGAENVLVGLEERVVLQRGPDQNLALQTLGALEEYPQLLPVHPRLLPVRVQGPRGQILDERQQIGARGHFCDTQQLAEISDDEIASRLLYRNLSILICT